MKTDGAERPNMAVSIGRLVLKNPVITASGTFGYGEEFAPYLDLDRLGGMVIKGISEKPRMGNPSPRIVETPSGLLNAIGLENVGVDAFITEKAPFLETLDTTVIANIFGESVDEYARVAGKLTGVKCVDALEVNISCPNVKRGGMDIGADPEQAAEVTRAVRQATNLPVIVKLTPNVTDITAVARRVEAAGADALSLINTLRGMSVDIYTARPRLANVTGGLSGPAIRPLAVLMVWETVQAVSIPVIGMGGIMNACDALEFLIAGARAIEVGTANFVNPAAVLDIIDGIERHLGDACVDDINDIIGTLDCRRK
ncbi:MAG: dihydroorotate dehydrogenase [delta proteobacterium MLS_D]|jgi:dihydroorotate dehydrogenase (NAD+) catalytic subunit|nr:MAG: dihydroorotate dehydrogenase [delta proteobacterium MLS_D]